MNIFALSSVSPLLIIIYNMSPTTINVIFVSCVMFIVKLKLHLSKARAEILQLSPRSAPGFCAHPADFARMDEVMVMWHGTAVRGEPYPHFRKRLMGPLLIYQLYLHKLHFPRG